VNKNEHDDIYSIDIDMLVWLQ